MVAIAAADTADWPFGAGSASPSPTSSILIVGSPLYGKAAPDFSLTDADGQTVRLRAYRGRPLIVNFWASWCIPCRTEFPLFRTARATYASQGLEILGVVYKDSVASASAFMRSEGATWPMLLDPSGTAAAAYKVQTVPMSFYLDASGVVRAVSFGPPPDQQGLTDLLALIMPGLAGSAVPATSLPVPGSLPPSGGHAASSAP